MSSVRASHILLMYEGSARSSATRSKAEAESQINALKAEIDGGADFAQLAQANSDCPSGRKGGDLGSFGRGQMVPAFERSAFALEVREISDAVESPFGFHVIQRLE